MRSFILLFLASFLWAGGQQAEMADTKKIVVATVNNPDMIIMKEMSPQFTEETGIEVQFVVLPENDLRQKVTQDVALGNGNYDIVSVGTYEAPLWAENEWIVSLEPYFDKMNEQQRTTYDRDDIFSSVQTALSSASGELYALPFSAEGSIVYYRKDIFEEAGLEMPYEPTWQQIADFARQLNNPEQGFYGIVLRGLPGWGQNLGPLNTVVNAFGGRWYDMGWNPQFNSPEMRAAWKFYRDLLIESGEPSPSSVGFTEALTIMSSGKAAMWYDATVAAGFLESPDAETKGKIGYALAPTDKKKNNSWFWSWALAIEGASKQKDTAFEFLSWATSKEYLNLVGTRKGWAQVPGGTRQSLYDNPQYREAAGFAQITTDTLSSIQFDKPTLKPVPYRGITFMIIPEFQGLGEEVSQEFASYLVGDVTLDQALENSNQAALEVAERGGYKK